MMEIFHLRKNYNQRRIKKYLFSVLIFCGIYFVITREWSEGIWVKEKSEKVEKIESEINKFLNTDIYNDIPEDDERISYENKRFIEYEKQRNGPGELIDGRVIITDPSEIIKNEKWLAEEGFYVVVSDKISLDRALPDWRPKACQSKKYLRNLPKVSIVIIFHNEILSVLLRLLHSVINRSPPQLLHEIVLVNDASTYENLGKELEDHIAGDFFEGKVKYHKNEKREGTIRTRMIGARLAEAEVIIFLDSHMEVATTWLPPLLEPIVNDPTVATVPIIESLDPKTFDYITIGNGYNGIFDWSFRYQYLPVDPKYRTDLGENYPLACLTAGAYAIRREHFFNLGGYDEGMTVYNGENWTMCFKLWLCNGSLMHVPCSRVIHLSKHFSAHRHPVNSGNYFERNLKRVAEVWMDDYKKYFYRTDPIYETIDAGDLTAELSVKERLKCKPFQYYLDHIAPQILMLYPLEPRYYATGNVQSFNGKCLKFAGYGVPPAFGDCNHQDISMNFTLNMEQSIRFNSNQDQCIDASNLKFTNCQHMIGPQQWFYNVSSHQLKAVRRNMCLNNKNDQLELENCNENSNSQKWKWTVMNDTAIESMNEMKLLFK